MTRFNHCTSEVVGIAEIVGNMLKKNWNLNQKKTIKHNFKNNVNLSLFFIYVPEIMNVFLYLN